MAHAVGRLRPAHGAGGAGVHSGPHGMRYLPTQYDRSACAGMRKATADGSCPDSCAGLGIAGNVCPVVLDCHRCVQSLTGFGFNPSIVRAPPHLRRGGIAYIGTDRFEPNNK